PCFPPDAIHIVVVDPGVGTTRALLHVEVAGHRLLAPDNGCWTLLDRAPARPPTVRRLSNERFWRQPLSSPFHRRDIRGPVASHLGLGVKPDELGSITTEWVRLEMPVARPTHGGVAGEIVYVDHFGNLLSNIPHDMIRKPPALLTIGKRKLRQFRWVKTYGAA